MSITRKTSMSALGAAIITLSLFTGAAPAATAAEQDLPGWILQEDVDLSDSSRWTLETGQAANTSSYDTPSNVSFGTSGLTVRGSEENRGNAAYTSGDAKGTGIVIPNYSRVEATGSMPYGSGLWPALMWLRPLDSANGEIDLVEVFGADPRPAATIHNEYGSTHRSLQGSVRWEQLPDSDPTGVHTYVMEKTPNRIVISVDGHVMLDAGPEDVRPGFDWDAIFERPGATWYPRVTLQIGCAPTEPDCGIGLPAAGWKGGEISLQSLKVWRMAKDGEQDPVVDPPVIETPEVETPEVEPPVVVPPVPAVESGTFALAPGKELRHTYEGDANGSTDGTVSFTVPKNLGTGVLYQSIQIASSDDGRSGYRATITLKSSGSIRLTLAKITGNRSEVLKDLVVAPRGSYAPGDAVKVSLSAHDGTVAAKAWKVGATEPEWQVTAQPGGVAPAGDGIRILGYLSQKAPSSVKIDWSGLTAQVR